MIYLAALCPSIVRGVISALCDRICRPEWNSDFSVSFSALDAFNALSTLPHEILFTNSQLSSLILSRISNILYVQLSIYFDLKILIILDKNGVNILLKTVNELHCRGSINGNVDSFFPLSIHRNSIGEAPSFSLKGSTQFRMLLFTLFDVQQLITVFFHIGIRKSPLSNWIVLISLIFR